MNAPAVPTAPAAPAVSAAPLPGLDWAALLRPGDHVVCSHMTGEPVALLNDLAARAPAFGFSLTLGVPFTPAVAGLPPQVTITTFGGMGTAGRMARSRDLSIATVPYGRCASVYDSGAERVDVALVSLVRGDGGQLWIAGSHGYIVEAARRARCIVAEVNAAAPRVAGAPWPADLPPHHVVEVSYTPPVAAAVKAGPVESAIGAHVAPLVADGACLQVGIGAIASAVVQALAGHRHLGVHSGMFTDPLMALTLSGAIDHSRKPAGQRLAVTGCVYGSESLYAFADNNSRLSLREPGFTHDPQVVAQIAGFTALNSAVEVDLLGQMNAEWLSAPGARLQHIGGVGGLNDFMRAARFAPQGQAVTALPSRAGGRPRIVARLSGPATVAAQDADLVVTEQGVARLRDASLGERVQRMIAIAHPEDRDGLQRQARETGLLA